MFIPNYQPFFWQERENSGQEPISEQSDSFSFKDFRGPCLLTVICRIAWQIFKSPPVYTLFLGSVAFFATCVVRKLAEDYTFMHECERLSLTLVCQLPYLQLIACLVALVFSWYLPTCSTAIILFSGVLG